MRTFVFVIGILVMLEGLALVIKPAWYRAVLGYFTKGRLIYTAGIAKTALGVVFLMAATSCQRFWLMVLLGILTCASGLSVFVVFEKIKAMLQWWHKKPDMVFRLLGILVIAMGLLFAYAAGIPK